MEAFQGPLKITKVRRFLEHRAENAENTDREVFYWTINARPEQGEPVRFAIYDNQWFWGNLLESNTIQIDSFADSNLAHSDGSGRQALPVAESITFISPTPLPVRRRGQNYPGAGYYDPKIHDYFPILEEYFQKTEDKRGLFILRSAKKQLSLLLSVIEGDASAAAQIQLEYPVRESPAEGEGYRDEDYLTMDRTGNLIDMREVTRGMSLPGSELFIVAEHYAQITGDKYTSKRLFHPLASIMDEVLDAGERELGWMVAEIYRRTEALKGCAKSEFFMNLPPLARKDEVIDDFELQVRATQASNKILDFRKSMDFPIGHWSWQP